MVDEGQVNLPTSLLSSISRCFELHQFTENSPPLSISVMTLRGACAVRQRSRDPSTGTMNEPYASLIGLMPKRKPPADRSGTKCWAEHLLMGRRRQRRLKIKSNGTWQLRRRSDAPDPSPIFGRSTN